MTQISPTIPVPIQRRRRRFLTQRQKDSVYAAHGGLCGLCGLHVGRLAAEWDHRIERDLTQCDDVGEFWPVHRKCHRDKTSERAPVLAHVKRLIARQDGSRRARKPIASPVKPWPKGRKMQSRGFRT